MRNQPKQQGRTLGERLIFLKQFLNSPRYLGSITPSSQYLVKRLVSMSNVSAVRHVVELGPGTGPFTNGLLDRLSPDGRLLCIERDAELSRHLRERFSDDRLSVVTGDAQELGQHMAEAGFPQQVSLIVSGLPFTSLPKQVRDSILAATVECLSHKGSFLLYQYSYAMRGELQKHFSSIESKWEVRNIPPAVCMRCRI